MERLFNDIQQIKYEVLKEVARLAFADELYQKLDTIPYTIIPGTKARFRCCVYREREIVRQRVNLAMGKPPVAEISALDKRWIYVIPTACEGCPIQRFLVTENCQGCMARKCIQSCPWEAISLNGKKAYIDPDKCHECGRCKEVCPYNAIVDIMRPCKRACAVGAISMDEEKRAVIDYSKCTLCGNCVRSCPFGAISDVSSMVDVINLLKKKKKVSAIIAPSIDGQFGQDTALEQIKTAIMRLGFFNVIEVALGADIVAAEEAEEVSLRASQGQLTTSSCCPAFVNLIHKHFPKLSPCISHSPSPMIAISKHIKQQCPDAKVVFIGPCIAKKAEVSDFNGDYGPDSALTFEELLAMLDARHINIKDLDHHLGTEASSYGRGFAKAGGVTLAITKSLEDKNLSGNITSVPCEGIEQCRKLLSQVSRGQFTQNFIEGMMCLGGCIGGPASITPLNQMKKIWSKKGQC